MYSEPCARLIRFMMPKIRVSPAAIRNSMTPNWNPFSTCSTRWIIGPASPRQGSRQLGEKRLRLLQVGRVEALGEPAVDRGEQFLRLGPPALLAPQPREARRGAQLQRFRLLSA